MSIKKIYFRKSTISVILSILSFLIFSISAHAESIFLKDGTIAEGTIESETDKVVKLKTVEGKLRDIPRRDVLRTLHHTDYTQKKYIYKTDKSLVEAFVVDEDKLTYTYRVDLNSASEFKILKSEINTISKTKIEFASDAKEKGMTREEEIIARASRLRFGAGWPLVPVEIMNKDWGSMFFFNLDAVVYRMRNAKSNGLDFFVRGSSRTITRDGGGNSGSNVTVAPSVVNGFFGNVVPSDFDTQSIKWSQMSLGTGIRYIHGFYFAGILWQGYVMAYYQYSMLGIDIKESGVPNRYLTLDYTSKGIVGGAGIEVALSSYFGIFAEFTGGYSPAFKSGKNSEGRNLNIGATMRTSYL